MKILLTTLNSKYIHSNLALRILRNDLLNNGIVHDMIEFTIKEDEKVIIEKLLEYDIIGISCYIYNIEKTNKILNIAKKLKPSLKIILGGPEVSFLTKEDLTNLCFDYIVCGEGEQELVLLLNDLKSGSEISNEYIISKTNKLTMNKKVNYVHIDYALNLTNDLYNIDLKNQIVYFETSRGCPYKCSYCQASLDNNVRNFPLDYVFKKIDTLLQNKAKTVKLLDRTFNFDVERTNKIINYIIENDNGYTTFQFEITGELLSDSSIDLINKNAREHLFRFEIGIQSTNKKANEAVRRYQNFSKLKDIIFKIQSGNKIVLHLDLIAGLPNEDLKSFKETFNSVFAFDVAELQLGFLKLLKGTALNEDIIKHGYVFEDKAPYQIISSKYLTSDDLKKIENVEHGLEHLYNHKKARQIIKHLLDKYKLNAFELFETLGKHIRKDNLQMYDIYQVLLNSNYLKDEDDLIETYLNYYYYHKQRPKSLSKIGNKKELLHQLIQEKELVQNEVFNASCIEKINEDSFFIYLIDKKKYYLIKKERR